MFTGYLPPAAVDKMPADKLPALIRQKFGNKLVEVAAGLAVVLETYPDGSCQVCDVAEVERRLLEKDQAGGFKRFFDLWRAQGLIE